MKTLTMTTLFCLLCFQNIVCSQNDTHPKNTHHLNKCLDPSSLILQRCTSTPRRMWPFESSTTKACDYINNYLLCLCLHQGVPPVHDVMVADDPLTSGLVISAIGKAEENMKDAIRTVLDDQPDKIKWQEFSKVKQASKTASEIGVIHFRAEREKF